MFIEHLKCVRYFTLYLCQIFYPVSTRSSFVPKYLTVSWWRAKTLGHKTSKLSSAAP